MHRIIVAALVAAAAAAGILVGWGIGHDSLRPSEPEAPGLVITKAREWPQEMFGQWSQVQTAGANAISLSAAGTQHRERWSTPTHGGGVAFGERWGTPEPCEKLLVVRDKGGRLERVISDGRSPARYTIAVNGHLMEEAGQIDREHADIISAESLIERGRNDDP